MLTNPALNYSWKNHCFLALRFSLLMFALCGIIYPVTSTFMGKTFFPWQASGSLIKINNEVRGSALIAQSFESETYFHSRPSAINYDPLAAGGSNLAPSNPQLRARLEHDSAGIQSLEHLEAKNIPVDRLATSGSGLDPHLTPDSALMQIPRIAKARNIAEAELKTLVQNHIEDKHWNLLGQQRVNVLRLNLALDEYTAKP